MATKSVLKGLLVSDDFKFPPIPFIFNPSEIDDEKSTEYAELNVLGHNNPKLHFKYGGMKTISFQIHMNDEILGIGSLELYVVAIRSLQTPSRGLGILERAPSPITLIYGPYVVKGVISNTKVKRQRFTEFLLLKEVTIDFTMKEIKDEEGLFAFLL